MDAKVSVIIPCFNAERFLADTLQCVLSQAYDKYEIVAVDDGSTDGTRLIAENFRGVRYTYQTNRGPAAARNSGLNSSTGEYVSFLDADDFWHPEMLERCIEILEAQPTVGAVHTNWLPVDTEGHLVKDRSGWQPWRGNIFDRLLVHIPFNTSSVVWRRSYWEDIGGFDQTPEINDDWINWLRIARQGCLFEAIKKPLTFRRVHEGSITNRQSKRIIQWRFNALDQICAEFNLPQPLRRRAYAEVHWIATTASLREGRCEDSIDHFRQAIAENPMLLELNSTYYAIAYGGKSADELFLDLAQGASRVCWFLDQLFSESMPTATLAKWENEVRSRALICLAQIAYGKGPTHAGSARRFFLQAIQKNPKLIMRMEDLMWLMRILLGPRLVRTASSLFRKKEFTSASVLTDG